MVHLSACRCDMSRRTASNSHKIVSLCRKWTAPLLQSLDGIGYIRSGVENHPRLIHDPVFTTSLAWNRIHGYLCIEMILHWRAPLITWYLLSPQSLPCQARFLLLVVLVLVHVISLHLSALSHRTNLTPIITHILLTHRLCLSHSLSMRMSLSLSHLHLGICICLLLGICHMSTKQRSVSQMLSARDLP